MEADNLFEHLLPASATNPICCRSFSPYSLAALDQEDHHLNEWDEEMIRQLVHTVKVISADHIRVYLNDGTEIDQTVSP